MVPEPFEITIASEDDILTISLRGGRALIEAMAAYEIDENRVILHKFHIQGSEPNSVGPAQLRRLAQAVME